jgi:uncharacterized protein with PIN domain
MPLKTEEVFRMGSEKFEEMHFLSCSECGHTVRWHSNDAEPDADVRAAAESWLCEDCETD